MPIGVNDAREVAMGRAADYIFRHRENKDRSFVS